MSNSINYVFAFTSLVVSLFGQNCGSAVTNFTASNKRLTSESLPKDFYIGTIFAYDPDDTPVACAVERNGGDNTPSFFQPRYETYIDENIIDGANVPALQLTLIDIDLAQDTLSSKSLKLEVNDNTPSFSKISYEAYIDENIIDGANVPGLQLTLIDIDLPSYEAYIDENIIEGANIPGMQLTLIDIDNAQETLNTSPLNLDINDNTPSFFQPSYQIYIEEDIIDGANIPGMQLTSIDIDNAQEILNNPLNLAANDNAPSFSQPCYYAYIDENIIDGDNVPGLQLTLIDIDYTMDDLNINLLKLGNSISDTITSSIKIFD